MFVNLSTISTILIFLIAVSVINIYANPPTQVHNESSSREDILPQENKSVSGRVSPGFLLVVHSQSKMVPRCPNGHDTLWNGFSLLYTESNGVVHNEDLGSAGSCVMKFSTLPYMSCDINYVCTYATRDDRSYWLSTNEPMPMMPLTGGRIMPYISRCVVCEAPTNVIAVHSQSFNIPSCPASWDELWNGYSFIMHSGGGQTLSSPGSCLRDFRPHPFIECSGQGGSCFNFATLLSYWLTTTDSNSQFSKPQQQILKSNLEEKVSRCVVCTKQ